MKSRAFLLCSSASFPSPPGQLSRAKFKSLLKNLHTLVLPLPWRNGERQAARKSERERERERELYCGRCLVTGRPHLHALNELGLALSLSLSLSLSGERAISLLFASDSIAVWFPRRCNFNRAAAVLAPTCALSVSDL